MIKTITLHMKSGNKVKYRTTKLNIKYNGNTITELHTYQPAWSQILFGSLLVQSVDLSQIEAITWRFGIL